MSSDEDPWVGFRDLLSNQPPREEDIQPITADTIRKAIEALRNMSYRVCHHLIPPNVDVVWDFADLDGTERAIPCAAMCGEVLIVRPRKPPVVEPLTTEGLLKLADELRYKRVPVEGRLTAPSMIVLRRLLQPDPTKPTYVAKPLDVYSGIRLIVDPTIEPNVIEFRDVDGTVTHRITL